MKSTKKKINKVPRKLSLVKFDYDSVRAEDRHYYPFKEGKAYLFLGEILNMPGHCAVVGDNERVRFGYHTDNFVELTEDET
jgi:hypothetical protein